MEERHISENVDYFGFSIYVSLSLGFKTVSYGIKGRRSTPAELLVSTSSFSPSSTINAKNSGGWPLLVAAKPPSRIKSVCQWKWKWKLNANNCDDFKLSSSYRPPWSSALPAFVQSQPAPANIQTINLFICLYEYGWECDSDCAIL